MKKPQNLELKSSDGAILKISIQRDLVKVLEDVVKKLDVAFRYSVFPQVEVAISMNMLSSLCCQFMSPEHDPERFYLMVLLTSLDPNKHKETFYIKWRYIHYDGTQFESETYLDIKKMVKIDNLLASQLN
jgi:hypothetical protein